LLAWPSNHVNYFSCCGVGVVDDGCCVSCWRKEVCRDYYVRKKGGSSRWLPLLPARKWSNKGTGPPTFTLLVRWWWLKKETESEKEKRELLAREGKTGGG